METEMRQELLSMGAALGVDLMTFGVLDERLYLREENRGLLWESGYRWSISLASRLLESYCELLLHHTDEGLMGYFHAYCTNVAERLDDAGQRICATLECRGFRAFLMPGRGKGYRKGMPGVISHVALARLSGMGTMGISGMLLAPEFGPRVRLATILTSCPLAKTPTILQKEVCADCGACQKCCPVECIQGKRFDPNCPEVQYIDKEACGQYRDKRQQEVGTRFCNLCMAVCPVGKGIS